MAYSGQADNSYGYGDMVYREPGARRKKLAGYLRAANELRQTYSQSWNARSDDDSQDRSVDPNGIVNVSNGEAQMLLFPSYAKHHAKKAPSGPNTLPGAAASRNGTGDADFWKRQWEQYENDRAIVDVDVRGWVFTPHTGPLSRKHRLMVALARQLVGIPAPRNSPTVSRTGSRQSSPTRRQSRDLETQLASQQADAIIKKGEAEADAAGKGKFSEMPKDSSDEASIYGDEPAPSLPPRRQNTSSSNLSDYGNDSGMNQTTALTPAELAVANANLMTRLKPFMANPLTSSTVNVFFYNETTSRQKTVITDAYGHFDFRTPLDFIPTHVRVMASEGLSIQEEVKIVPQAGVSLISDVDDTIRHSAITKGAREIFRNAFVRDYSTLTIGGVKEWYNKVSDMGVQVHYVSNSPWQLFPAMTAFFAAAGLPKGSFHLKQYSGMLQGIFEPVAERKKSTLERLLRDFPERKFILVGDSGEADLEVYTDVVIEHPGRVLAVLIRDVTTPPNKGFFDPSLGPASGSSTPKGRGSREQSVESLAGVKARSSARHADDDDADYHAAIAASLRDMDMDAKRREQRDTAGNADKENAPQLPARPMETPRSDGNEFGDLIDFSDDVTPTPSTAQPRQRPPVPKKRSSTASTAATAAWTSRPPPPSKPARLRSPSNGQAPPVRLNTSLRSPPPPLPRKPSSSVSPAAPSPLQQVQVSSPVMQKAPPQLPDRPGYRTQAKQKLTTVYNALPSASNILASAGYSGDHAYYTTPRPAQTDARPYSTRAPPSFSGRPVDALDDPRPVDKREELWKRRWRRAQDVLGREKVLLRTWRVGSDVMDECVAAVQAELERQKRANWRS